MEEAFEVAEAEGAEKIAAPAVESEEVEVTADIMARASNAPAETDDAAPMSYDAEDEAIEDGAVDEVDEIEGDDQFGLPVASSGLFFCCSNSTLFENCNRTETEITVST